MSFFFAEGNRESTFDLFRKRSRYLINASTDQRSMTDFVAEKYMYGRVNRVFTPIYVDGRRDRIFKSFSQKPNDRTNVTALNFVVDAFNDLAQNFAKAAQTGKIDPNDPFLSNLKVYRGYEDPIVRYNRYISVYVNNFKEICDGLDKKVENFDMMNDTLQRSLRQSNVTSPFSFPAFVKNRRTPITISGLAIEIANIDMSNDLFKAELFLNSKNWEYFLNAAEVFGFMVDKNVPWRLVADIGSEQMQEYAKNYGFETTDEILSNYFSSANFAYFLRMPRRMYNIYETVKPSSILTTVDINGSTRRKINYPKTYENFDVFMSEFDENYFIDLYCKIRFIEEESQYTESEREALINDTQQLAATYEKSKAIRQFETVLNNTLDYSGNLRYYIEKAEAVEGAEMQRAEESRRVTVGY